MRVAFSSLLILFLLQACLPPDDKQSQQKNPVQTQAAENSLNNQTLEQALIGDWQSVSLEITMPSYNNTDSVATLTADPENWGEIMQMQPIITHFRADHTYTADYRNLQGELINQPSGTWKVEGNVLEYRESHPQFMVIRQTVERIDDQTFRFTFNMDYDSDGLQDDTGVGISKKIN
jgi:hypothetical protein